MSDINGMIISQYFDKQVDYSATDFTRPNYQLWAVKNMPNNEDKQGFEPWVGQLIHNASYNYPEKDVIKEFSFEITYDLEWTIGGSIDRIERIDDTWYIADIKTQGMFPAKNAFAKGKDEWVTQLSIYAWAMRRYGFNVSDTGIIHQYVLGYQKNKDGMDRYNKILIKLHDDDVVEYMIQAKIEASLKEPVSCDCPKYLCGYCPVNKSCSRSNV